MGFAGRPATFPAGAALTVLALAVAACSPSEQPDASAAGRNENLLVVPFPEISSFAESVQEQLREGRAALEEALARDGGTVAELGEAFGRAGRLYHAYALRDAAEVCYLNAQQLIPDEFRWPYFLGHLYNERGAPDLALASLERAMAIRSDYVPALTLSAEVHYDQNQLDLAESLYRRALALDARCASALLGLGKIASSRHDFSAAVEHLEAALAIDPEASEINYPLGVAYRSLGRQDQAAAFLERRGTRRAEVDDPLLNEVRILKGGPQFFQNRGSRYFEEGQHELAMAEFEKAVEAAPDDAGAHTNLGLTLAVLGDRDGAQRELRTAVRLDPTSVIARYNLGELLSRRGNDEQAVAHYRAALATNPAHLPSHRGLTHASRRLGRFEEAARHARRVVEADPGDAAARITEALTLIRLHRYAEARGRLDEARAIFPEDPAILNALARVLAAAPEDSVRDAGEAVSIGRKIALQPLSLDSAVTLAMIAANNGEFGPAQQLQQQAIQWAQRMNLDEARRAALREDLALYEEERPSRRPWPDDHPALSPPPLAPGP